MATVASAADELRDATRPDPSLPVVARMRNALDAHLDWIDAHAVAYRAILQGGISSDAAVHAIVEGSRSEVVDRLAEAFGLARLAPVQRIALRGWVGFLGAACLDCLAERDIPKADLAALLAASIARLPLDADATIAQTS